MIHSFVADELGWAGAEDYRRQSEMLLCDCCGKPLGAEPAGRTLYVKADSAGTVREERGLCAECSRDVLLAAHAVLLPPPEEEG